MTLMLRLAFDPEFAPFSLVEAGRPAGRAIELVRAACMRAGVELELVPVGLGTRGFAECRLDGFACMAVTPGRTDCTFSVPYLTTSAALFLARPAAGSERERPREGIAVVTPQAGPLLRLLAERIASAPPALAGQAVTITRVVPGTDYRQCLRRVLDGEVAAAALNAEVGRCLVARLFPGAFCEVPAPLDDLLLAVALSGDRADATSLLSRLDPALEAVVAEASSLPAPRRPLRPGGKASS